MLQCLRLHGTSDTQSVFDLCSLKGKNPLWLSNVSHFFPSNLVYRCCREFICEWKWLWRHHALFCPNNNTYFFHFMVFTESGKKTGKWKYKVVFKDTGFIIHAQVRSWASTWTSGFVKYFIFIYSPTVPIDGFFQYELFSNHLNAVIKLINDR